MPDASSAAVRRSFENDSELFSCLIPGRAGFIPAQFDRHETDLGLGRLRLPFVLRRLLEQLRDESGPAGLVAGADPAPLVPVEVLVEEKVRVPVRVVRELRRAAEDG